MTWIFLNAVSGLPVHKKPDVDGDAGIAKVPHSPPKSLSLLRDSNLA